jgi:hypothetical protein
LFEGYNFDWERFLPSWVVDGNEKIMNILLEPIHAELAGILKKEQERKEVRQHEVKKLLFEKSRLLKSKIRLSQEFRRHIDQVLNNLLVGVEKRQLPHGSDLPAGAVTAERYQEIKAIIGRALAESSNINSLLFMDSCRAEFLPKLSLLERIPNNCHSIITGIITEYERGNPPLSVLPPVNKLIVVSVEAPPQKLPPRPRLTLVGAERVNIASPQFVDASIETDTTYADNAVDAAVDLERPHLFLSRVVGVLDGMLGNAKFVGYDRVGCEPRIDFAQYKAIRDAVNETLNRIHHVPPSEFFQKPDDFLRS